MEFLKEILNKILSLLPQLHCLKPYERGIKITLGKHLKEVGPGAYFIWPIIHDLVYMDVQECVVDLRVQSVWTCDGHELAVSGGIRYAIKDVVKAICNIQDINIALANIALGTIVEFVNQRSLESCHNLVLLKDEILKGLRKEARGWGTQINDIYITDMGKTRNLRLLHSTDTRPGSVASFAALNIQG
jgi:hypothetical protein